MTLKASTGLRNAMLVTGSLRATMSLGFIKIYAGAVPADADASIGAATLLCTISNNSSGTGLTLESAVAAAGVAEKTIAEVWSGVNGNTGTATFFRYVAPGDDGTLSTSQPRLQGSVGVSGAELNLSSVSLTSAATQTIDFFNIAQPTL